MNKKREKKTKTPPSSLFPFLTLLIQEAAKNIKNIVKKLIKTKWDYGSHTPLPPFGGSLYRPFFMLAYLFNNLLKVEQGRIVSNCSSFVFLLKLDSLFLKSSSCIKIEKIKKFSVLFTQLVQSFVYLLIEYCKTLKIIKIS